MGTNLSDVVKFWNLEFFDSCFSYFSTAIIPLKFDRQRISFFSKKYPFSFIYFGFQLCYIHTFTNVPIYYNFVGCDSMKGVAVCCVRFCRIFLICRLFWAHDVLQLSSPSGLAFIIKALKLCSFQNLLVTMNWIKTKLIKYLQKKFFLKLNTKMLAYKQTISNKTSC